MKIIMFLCHDPSNFNTGWNIRKHAKSIWNCKEGTNGCSSRGSTCAERTCSVGAPDKIFHTRFMICCHSSITLCSKFLCYFFCLILQCRVWWLLWRWTYKGIDCFSWIFFVSLLIPAYFSHVDTAKPAKIQKYAWNDFSLDVLCNANVWPELFCRQHFLVTNSQCALR